jgi:signal transduction histidine kinase
VTTILVRPGGALRVRGGLGLLAHSLSGAVVAWFYAVLLAVVVPVTLLLSVVVVGLPLLLGELVLCRGLAAAERRWANRLLGTSIPAPTRPVPAGDGRWSRVTSLVSDPTNWRNVGFLLARTAIGVVAFTVLVYGLDFVFATLVGGTTELTGNDHITGTWTGLWGIPVGVVGLAALVAFLTAWGLVSAAAARALLGPSAAETIRALTARSEELARNTRLARELHDTVGHAMTAVAVQASAAEQVFDDDPAFAKAAHANIGASARRALEELDQVLGLLREEPSARGGPPPGLADVHELVTQVRAAGLPVEVDWRGDPRPVPAEVSETMYRIVQEGCTNVLRHAGMVPTVVVVAVDAAMATVEVGNGPPAGVPPMAGPGPGRGIAGMRERVRALGGECEAGPGADGGFVLRATVPLRPPSP